MDKYTTNINAINAFKREHKLKDVGGPIIIFDALVTYSPSGRPATHGKATVQIATDTDGYGKITVDGDSFDPYTVHTEFLPRYQDYAVDGEELVITGQSSVHGGSYYVRITLIH